MMQHGRTYEYAQQPAPKPKRRPLKIVLLSLLALVIVGIGVGVGVAAIWCQDLPDVTNADQFNYAEKTKVYANDKTTLLAEFYLENREPVSSDKISDNVKKAAVATEDVRFYEHNGVDPIGIARALLSNLMGGSREGASTITQQFVRNTVLAEEADEITVKRKIREAVLAMQLEDHYSKDEILTMYLNTINYGDNCYGIEVAAEHYFSKTAAELTATEAATLVAIPQSPTYNNPVTYPANNLERRNLVLDRMVSAGYLDAATAAADKALPLGLVIKPASDSSDGIYAYPYFTSYVRDQLCEQYSVAEVFKGGLTVYTTLDVAMQEAAQEACDSQLEWMDDDIEASLTSIDPYTGEVKAMIGGRDYYTDQFNLATQAHRQAGSSFKAFTLVAALEAGISPNCTINCNSPVTLNGWRVENYDGASYGTRTITSATAVSSNTGYARLITKIGSEPVADVAKRMGVTSEIAESDPSITLGTTGVNTLEMADAYATFANGGMHYDPIVYTQILNSAGTVIYNAEVSGSRAISPEIAYAATNVLKTVFTSGTATAAQLYSGQVAAGKTGTSENWRDHWLCGYTPQLSTAVWIGSRQERNTNYIDCSNLWRTYTSAALQDYPIEQFPQASDPYYSTWGYIQVNGDNEYYNYNDYNGYSNGYGNSYNNGYSNGYNNGYNNYNSYNDYDEDDSSSSDSSNTSTGTSTSTSTSTTTDDSDSGSTGTSTGTGTGTSTGTGTGTGSSSSSSEDDE